MTVAKNSGKNTRIRKKINIPNFSIKNISQIISSIKELRRWLYSSGDAAVTFLVVMRDLKALSAFLLRVQDYK